MRNISYGVGNKSFGVSPTHSQERITRYLHTLFNRVKYGKDRRMTRTFIQTKVFSKKWDELGLTDDDLRRLEYELEKERQENE